MVYNVIFQEAIMKLLAILLISLLASPVAAQQYWQGKDRAYYQEKQDRRIERQTRETQEFHNKQGYRIYRGNTNQYHPLRNRNSRSYNGLDRALQY
jgi:hypothetical protein